MRYGVRNPPSGKSIHGLAKAALEDKENAFVYEFLCIHVLKYILLEHIHILFQRCFVTKTWTTVFIFAHEIHNIDADNAIFR